MLFRFITALAIACSASLPAAQTVAHSDDGHHAAWRDPAYVATVNFLESRIEAVPDDVASWSKLAARHLAEGRRSADHVTLKLAAEAFERVHELAPESSTAWRGIAYAQLGRHEFEAALAAAKNAERLEPDAPASWAVLGDVQFARGRYAKAELAFQRLLTAELSLDAFARMGLLHEARGRLPEARLAFENARAAARLGGASDVDRAWCAAILGDHERVYGDAQKSEALYREALELDARSRTAALGLSNILTHSSRVDDAVPILRRLVRAAPAPSSWMAYADALRVSGAPSEAKSWEKIAVHDMRTNLSEAEVGHARDLVEYELLSGDVAVATFELALAELTRRRDVESLACAAWAAHLFDRSDLALELIREALDWGTRDPRILERASTIELSRKNS